MDPLTHTLVGGNLAATRLGAKTRFATAALVVGANLPDVDGICYLLDSDLALGFRRGWTHGILAMVALPVIQALVLAALARMRRTAQEANFSWLVILSAIGIWSHPALDWLNTYGVRLLMPFSGRWFYGDSVYIMDLWLWLVLGVGYLAGRRATAPIIITGALLGTWVVRTIARRSPEHLPLLAAVVVVFIVALFWRGGVRRPELGRRFAAGALAIAAVYIGARVTLNELTESAVTRELARRGQAVEQIMTGPDPINPLQWSIVARTGGVYRYGEFDWRSREVRLLPGVVRAAVESEEWRKARRDPSIWGLVTWLRFPAYEVERRGGETVVEVFDARRAGGGRRSRVVVR